MFESDESMDMNSLMEAIYGDCHTEYISHRDQQFFSQIPEFMQSLISHLTQLCVTKGFADNVNRTLSPYIMEFNMHTHSYNQRNPKVIMENFLTDYLHLFNQQTNKINKYGAHKLKYLTNTVSKQIFTEIMRMACDFKLESVNRAHYLKSAHRTNNHVVLLTHAITRLFGRDLAIGWKGIKRGYQEEIKKEEGVVGGFVEVLGKLDRLYARNKRSGLAQALLVWRTETIRIAQQQTQNIYQQTQILAKQLLPSMLQSWQHNPSTWLFNLLPIIEQYLEKIFNFSCAANLELLGNPNLHVGQSLSYSSGSSFRSGISQISCIEIEECMKSQTIRFDNDNRLVVIPIAMGMGIREQLGVVRIGWHSHLPLIVLNRVVKGVEFIVQIIENYAKLTNRLEYYMAEYENGQWHSQLYNLSLKYDTISQPSLESILSSSGLSFLQIYHDYQNPIPCISYGNASSLAPIPINIYKLIWSKLETNSSFRLNRENTVYEILKLEECKGFCRYSFDNFEESLSVGFTVVQCVSVLMARNLGKIGCKVCNIEVKQGLLEQEEDSVDTLKSLEIQTIDYDLVMKVRDAVGVDEVEERVFEIMGKAYKKVGVFCRIFYVLDQANHVYVYRNKIGDRCSIQTINIPKIIVNQNIVAMEINQPDKGLQNFSQVLHSNALFSESEMYVYQNQKRRGFKFFPKKIGRKAIIVMGTYQNIAEQQIEDSMTLITNQINWHPNLFEKKDLFIWANQILFQKNALCFPNSSITNQLISSVQKLSIQDIFTKISHSFSPIKNNIKNHFVWKLKNKKVIPLIGSLLSSSSYPYDQLVSEPRQSHHNIKAAHRTLRSSKNCGVKLEQLLTYVPNFNRNSERLKYAEEVRKISPGTAQSIDSMNMKVFDYVQKNCEFRKEEHQFICIPVKFRQSTYIFMTVYAKQVYISEELFSSIVQYYNQIVPTVLNFKHAQMINNANIFLSLNPTLFNNSKQQLKLCLLKFYGNSKSVHNRNKTLLRGIESVEANQLFRQLRFGFKKIQNHATHYKLVYSRAASLLVQKILKIFGANPLFKKLRIGNESLKGALKIVCCLQSITKNTNLSSRVSKRAFLTKLIAYGNIIKNQSSINKTTSAFKIFTTLSLINRANQKTFFEHHIRNLECLKCSLKNLVEEFSLLHPSSSKSCLNFLNGRINLILKDSMIPQIVIKLGYYSLVNVDAIENENYVNVDKSSFMIEVVQSEHKNLVCQYLVPTLIQILPKWQIQNKKSLAQKTKILSILISAVLTKNLKHLFNVLDSQKNKENIQNLFNLKKHTKQQKQKMRELAIICNSASNLSNRDKHRRSIEELKKQNNAMTNIIDQAEIEMNIKSKTNAAYRMISFLNKKKVGESPKMINQFDEVHQRIKQDRFRFVCENLPIWHSSINKLFGKYTKVKAEEFIKLLSKFSY